MRLKVDAISPFDVNKLNFNPTIVRLKGSEKRLICVISLKFQSYHSAIKGVLPIRRVVRWIHFNPTIVRLKVLSGIFHAYGVA